ncbi:MAG: hypothetical protein RIT28_3032 [Pseudomonadota bacterium]
MSALSLAQRLLLRIAEISERSDVIVHQQSRSWSGPLGKWASKLPADMMAFYEECNGLVFRYAFVDKPDEWHGLELLALDSDGKKLIDTYRRTYRIPRQSAKRFPEYFFQDGAVEKDAQVLFFFGSDDAWGVLMIGEGEATSFHHWDNDGFVSYRESSFTKLIERLMDRGFAHTWLYSDTHPDTDAVVARLAKPAPPRPTFEITVQSAVPVTAADLRRDELAALRADDQERMLKALGDGKGLKGLSDADRLARLVAAFPTERPDDALAVKLLRARGYKGRDPAQAVASFFSEFPYGDEPLVRLQLDLRTLASRIPVQTQDETLVRALHGVPGLHVTEGFPGDPQLLRAIYLTRWRIYWTPFLRSTLVKDWGRGKRPTPSFQVVLRASQAEGLEAGKTYTSFGLTGVEERVEPA